MGLKFASIFIILVSLLGDQRAFADCRETLSLALDSKKTSFSTYWEKLSNLPAHGPIPPKLLNQVIESAARKLDEHGIKWILNPENEYSIIILPSEKREPRTLRRMPLDQFAAFTDQVLNKVRVEFNPKELVEAGAAALFIDTENRLVISNEEIEKGYITDQGLHEGAGHAYIAKLLSDGKETSLYGNVVSKNDKIKFHETYKNEFSLDELYAYSIQITDIIKDLIELKKNNASTEKIETLTNELEDIIDTTMRLSQHSAKAAAGALVAADLFVRDQKWPERKEKIEGIPEEVAVIFKDNMKIYFHRTIQGPKSHKEFQREVMNAVIGIGPIELELFLFDPKIIKRDYPSNDAALADVALKLRAKVAGLLGASSPLEGQYQEILKDLKKQNLSNALERSKIISKNLLL